jgi:SNF2 family DNA or RNA helicase
VHQQLGRVATSSGGQVLVNEEGGLRNHEWQSAYGPNDSPLESFYLPALSRAARYDRIAGFFSSYALAVAAQGLATLVARGGRMRLLVGAQLSAEDVDAILRGISLQDRLAQQFLQLLNDPEALSDALLRKRLEVLAWLVAHDQLEIRVVVEADPYTREPVPSGGYFHAKGGIFWDESGNGLAFSGSINETATAWRYNYERFHVFCSWREPEHFQQEAETFDRLWKNAEAGWLALDIPQAVRKELLRRAPIEPPTEEPALQPVAQEDAVVRWVAQYVRDAPFLVHRGWRVGVETAAVEPFPHQRSVAYSFLDNYPCRRLLAEEVGLGKTIEAGFILRSLLLSGWVKRCLIIVPRSLARQWQEELRARFWVEAPFYDGSRFVYFQEPENVYETIPAEASPWDVHPVVIASAQLVKRADRAESLLAAPTWDLVIVDEAHHARRRDFLDLRRYRPNRLLQLLERLRERTRAMLLLTATPMQVHPVEVWDLLRLLGMPGRWQSDQDAFLAYFAQFHLPYEEVPWDYVLPLLREAVGIWGWDKQWEQWSSQELGLVGLHRLKTVVEQGGAYEVLRLGEKERRCLREALRVHNPVQRLVSRHTRKLLREYYKRGLMKQHMPERRPEPVWLEMSDAEASLYRAVERYISSYYKRYEEVRRGLGFVMTIYRRRLTSSLYALQQSLIRRKQFLLGQWEDPERPMGLEDEDLEEADLTEDRAEEVVVRPAFTEEEIREIDSLLERLQRIEQEQKILALKSHLQEALARWNQVLVFTQYTDTMDFLRRELLPVFGSKLACYSGRGGEVWDSERRTWTSMSKDRVQRLFAEGAIRVLLCTEAGGEGLNLQNCAVLFNYDMPWNPMKVEQRIGRIDRIGQVRKEVYIRHYFYKGTVEAEVYKALGERIGWFETVVGELQPILHRAQAAIQRAAMEDPDSRGEVLKEEIEGLSKAYTSIQKEGMPLSQWESAGIYVGSDAPLTSADLQASLIATGDPRAGVPPHGTDELGRFARANPGVNLFGPESTGGNPPVRYGPSSVERMLLLPPPPTRKFLARFEARGKMRFVGYFHCGGKNPEEISNLPKLVELLSIAEERALADRELARQRFEALCKPLITRLTGQ